MKIPKNHRILVDIYMVPMEGREGDDITEETEDILNRDRDYYCQMQADSLGEIVDKFCSEGN
jgi:hypothetical protein